MEKLVSRCRNRVPWAYPGVLRQHIGVTISNNVSYISK